MPPRSGQVLALDLSTSTGWALLSQTEDGIQLLEYGLLEITDKQKKALQSQGYPWASIDIANLMGEHVSSLVDEKGCSNVVAEELNKGKAVASQKLLNFVHFSVLSKIRAKVSFSYVFSASWRKQISMFLSKEDRDHNKKVKAKKARGKITSKHLSVRWVNDRFKLDLKLKDNDIADAICLGYAFLSGCSCYEG